MACVSQVMPTSKKASMNMKPTLGRIVHYRGKRGYQAMRG